MKPRRKPQAGICTVCGCAVVQPTPNRFAHARARAQEPGRFWVSGHLYEERGGVIRLANVVCASHAFDRESDPRYGWEGERQPEMPLGYMQGRGAS